MEEKLTAKEVEEIFFSCLFKDNEIVDGIPSMEPVKVEGIINNFGFHPKRLQECRNRVIDLLKELPVAFFRNRGGGRSFLNACHDKNDAQWGEHRNIEHLFCLGIGLGVVRWRFPRSMWSVFPGGMPYVVVNVDI